MLKRPLKRVPVSPVINAQYQVDGGFVNGMIKNHSVTIRPVREARFGYQNVEQYKRMLKRNYVYYDVPYKDPDVIEATARSSNEKETECLVDFLDKVYLRLNILKSGKVRIKLVTNFVSFWKTYYSKGKTPPFKTILAACKALGYSEKFLNKMVINKKKRQDYVKVLEKIIETIFDKSTSSKKKVVKKAVAVVVVEDAEVFDTEVEEEEDETTKDDAEENEAIVEEDGEGDADEVVEEGGEEVYDEDE